MGGWGTNYMGEDMVWGTWDHKGKGGGGALGATAAMALALEASRDGAWAMGRAWGAMATMASALEDGRDDGAHAAVCGPLPLAR